MVVEQKYAAFDLEKGTLDSSIFSNVQTYQEELERIFGHAWLNICHESLVPNPNDFFLSYMGEDPVIVTRDAKGELHTFLNMCRHRGNRVVRADDGNAKNFMCTYHGWTFSNEGRLVSVPGLQEAYYGELDVEDLGLVEARVDTYAGLIFACWAEDAPTLEAYLGDARWYLDTRFNRRDCGEQAFGPLKWIEVSNWKTPVDNASDNYHVAVTHSSTKIVQVSFNRSPRDSLGHKALFDTPSKHLFVNGHSLTVRLHDSEETHRAALVHGRRAFKHKTEEQVSIADAFYAATLPETERRLGGFRARRLTVGNHSLFPNTVLGFRLSLPRGPFRTEFWHFGMVDKDAPEACKAIEVPTSAANDGINGFFEQDDMDNWHQVTHSGVPVMARRYPHVLSMGLGHATTSYPGLPGRVSERYISENNQRGYYARWQEFMNAESWNDIHIDPITSKFEGTATMKG